MWHELEERIESDSLPPTDRLLRRIIYVDFVAYDGVDVKVALKRLRSRLRSSIAAEALEKGVSSHEDALVSFDFNDVLPQNIGGLSKILQSEFAVGMGVQVADGARLNIKASFLPILLGMDHCNTKNLVAANRRIDPGSCHREICSQGAAGQRR